MPAKTASVMTRILLCLTLVLTSLSSLADNTLSAVRYWPSLDYSRLTFESPARITFKLFTLDSPPRLVLDLEDIDTNQLSALKTASDNINHGGDPWISKLRYGINRPGVLRLVFDLRDTVRPSAFNVKPVGDYANRMVLDIYPGDAAVSATAQADGAPNNTSNDTAHTKIQSANETQSVNIVANTMPAANPTQISTQKPKPSTPPETHPTLLPSPQTRTTDTALSNPSQHNDLTTSAFLQQKPLIIAIDPGHGGEDPGAHGMGGTLEKNVTLAIGRRVKDKLNALPGIHAKLTRDSDFFIPLAERVIKARNMGADLFVSIHADAFVTPDARGSSVFTLSEHGASSAAARWLAKSENDADLVGGVNIRPNQPDLARTLIDLSQTATNNDSRRLARDVLHQIGEINRLHKGEVEQAGFAVLKAPDIPSILVETAFISNPDEEQRLKSDAYQDEIADAIVKGIQQFFASNPATVRDKLSTR